EFEEELERSIPPDASGSVAVRLDSGEAGGGEDAKVSKRISSTSRRAASRRPSRKMITSLAIMPLVNTSSDPNIDYLSDGITETIINTLSQLPKLRVVARSTVFRYKGQEIDPREVGSVLNVQAVLTGRVRHVGDSLIVGVELTNAKSDSQLWGESYN